MLSQELLLQKLTDIVNSYHDSGFSGYCNYEHSPKIGEAAMCFVF